MNGLYSCIIAISMYSKIPMPNVEWSEDRMRYVMCFFLWWGLSRERPWAFGSILPWMC